MSTKNLFVDYKQNTNTFYLTNKHNETTLSNL